MPIEDSYTIPDMVRGFERLYPLLNSLTNVREEQSFFERIQIILLLLEWKGAPAVARDIERQSKIPTELLARHLSVLRSGGWLTDDDRYYKLKSSARMLAFILKIIAQPWEENDAAAVITQLYAAASSQELGLGAALLFADVVSTIEDSVSRLKNALSLDQTAAVLAHLKESTRNKRMADKALEIREQGTVDEDYAAVQRMHVAISALSVISGELEKHYTTLLERDLLTSGQVTLGDIKEWAAQTGDEDCAEVIMPFVHYTVPQPWFIPEGRLVSAEAEIAGRERPPDYSLPPRPEPFKTGQPTMFIDQQRQEVYRLQGQLRQLLRHQEAILLEDWVNQDEWHSSLLHMVVALDPHLQSGDEPIVLELDKDGKFAHPESGSVGRISEGTLRLGDSHV
jgi:hypothetical protein